MQPFFLFSYNPSWASSWPPSRTIRRASGLRVSRATRSSRRATDRQPAPAGSPAAGGLTMARAREAIRILACCLTVSWAGCVSAQNLSEQDAYDIAKDAYVYGVSLGHIG